jgi:hypothetical protein
MSSTHSRKKGTRSENKKCAACPKAVTTKEVDTTNDPAQRKNRSFSAELLSAVLYFLTTALLFPCRPLFVLASTPRNADPRRVRSVFELNFSDLI